MDYSLTTLFVVPVGNSLPTTGSTEVLTDGQFGVYKDEQRAAATNANISTASFIQFAQGRPNLYLGSKVSDKIKSTKVKKWYKVTGSGTAANEIWEVSDFTGSCGDSITLTLRGHSSYLDTISFNGLTRSITVQAPCCECGADPCTAIDNEALIDLIIAKVAQIDAAQTGPNALKITTFFTFQKVGTGAGATLLISSNTLTVYAQPCDIAANPYEYDRIWFRVWVTPGPATTVDFEVYNPCDLAGTTTLLQRSSFPNGTSTEVAQMEKDYYSYQSPHKHLFRTSGYNPYFQSWVTDGTIYDQYVIQFDELFQNDAWTRNAQEDERVILFIPQGSTSTIETMLVTYLGAITDESSTAITTTTTTSTTSTSTSTTTTLIP